MDRLRGVNLGGWFSQVDCIEEKDPKGFPGLIGHMDQFLGYEDLKKIADWGFNHVRLPVDYFVAFEEKTLDPKEDVLSRIDRVVEWAGECGLLLMFDLHKCPGHDFYEGTIAEQPFFTDRTLRDGAKQVWKILALRYGKYPHVMLEILNEPVAPSESVWNEVKDEMAGHIRKYAPNSTIVVGSNLWNSALTFAELTPLEDKNVLYSFHFYNPVTFTHQCVPWHKSDKSLSVKRPYPGYYEPNEDSHSRLKLDFGNWNRDRMKEALQPVIDFRRKYDLPVACGEFGVWAQVEREYMLNWNRDFMSILKEFDIGYSYWNYKNLDFGIISKGESLHENLERYNNPDRTDIQLKELLAQQ